MYADIRIATLREPDNEQTVQDWVYKHIAQAVQHIKEAKQRSQAQPWMQEKVGKCGRTTVH